MLKHFRTALVMLLSLTIITGVIYPLVITGIAQTVFPQQANGSLVLGDGEQQQGSKLIGQNFSQPKYFWGRLSATGPLPYNAAASSGSNLGPLNLALQEGAKSRIAALDAAGVPKQGVPVDLVTASASGLDPDISPAAAEWQVPRVAVARGMSEDKIRELVSLHTLDRQFGMLGEPRVNVLLLNLALDRQQKVK